MSKLQPIQLDDGTMIYVEATEDIATPEVEPETGEVGRTGQKGWGDGIGRASAKGLETATQSFNAIENTIKTYTKYTLNAFNDAALANVEKVTLEFGMNVSGGAGVPYIAAGTVNCNIKVTVECAFPERQAVAKVAQQIPQQVAPQQVTSQQMTPQQMTPQLTPQQIAQRQAAQARAQATQRQTMPQNSTQVPQR